MRSKHLNPVSAVRIAVKLIPRIAGVADDPLQDFNCAIVIIGRSSEDRNLRRIL